VDESLWRGSGPEFSLSWCARQWALKVDDPCPGLSLAQADFPAKLLALDRLEVPGRRESGAFSSESLIGYERYRRSVRATYAPPAWGGLMVRASWLAAARDCVDLEVQVSASSVGELERLEVGVVSLLGCRSTDIRTVAPISIRARDTASLAKLGGRDASEGARCDIQVFSETRPLRPSLFPAPAGPDDLYYAEMAHPDDVSMRSSFESVPEGSGGMTGHSVRCALFGLSLEKGVVLRARLRGCWIQSRSPEQDAAALYQEFLGEPPPLGP
jgi:hypothetical protein